MPEIFRIFGFSFFFYSREHERFTSTLKEMMVTRCLILLGMVSFFLNHKEINKPGEEYSSLIVE